MKMTAQSGLFLVVLAGLLGCGESKSASPKAPPQSQNLEGLRESDHPIIGSWMGNIPGFSSTTLTVSNAGVGSEQIKSEIFGIDVDYDFHYTMDTSVSPSRLTETVTAVRKQQGIDGGLAVGTTAYCIFELVDNHTLNHECSEDDQFPTAFSEEKETYQRK